MRKVFVVFLSVLLVFSTIIPAFSETVSTLENDYIIITSSEDWDMSKTIDKKVIIAPNAVVTISSGVRMDLYNDLIIYGQLRNYGEVYLNGHDIFANNVNIGWGQLTGDSNYLNYGVINPYGYITNVGNLMVDADEYPITPVYYNLPANNIVTSTSYTLTGKSVPGFKVKIGSVETIVPEDGIFRTNLTLNAGDNHLAVKVVDIYQREKVLDSLNIRVEAPKDTTPPPKPVIEPVTDQTVQLNGTTEPDASIEIHKGSSVLKTGTADQSGAFSITIATQSAGTKLYVYAIDGLGNRSEPSVVVVGDGTPPAKPVVNEVHDQSTLVTGSAEVGSEIMVESGLEVLGSTIVLTDSFFSVVIPKQKAGKRLTIFAKDPSGNESEPAIITVKDVTSPAKPNVPKITDQTTVITGDTEDGATVTLSKNGTVLGTAYAELGMFTFTISKQPVGTELKFIATDNAGLVSEPTIVKVTDGTPPAKPIVNKVKNTDTIVTGKAEPGSTIEIKLGTYLIGSGVTHADGNFSIAISTISASVYNELVVTATDAAGNKSAPAIITIQDGEPPMQPMVDEVTDRSTEVTGSTDANSFIEVWKNDSLLGSGSNDQNGRFKINIPLQSAGTALMITATDSSGNVSSPAIVTVNKTDMNPPAPPIVDMVTNQTEWVTGSTESNATVNIFKNYTLIGTYKTSYDGKFYIRIPKQPVNTKLVVTSVDYRGNTSEPTEVIVKDSSQPLQPAFNSLIRTVQDQLELTVSVEPGLAVQVKVGDTMIADRKAVEERLLSIKLPNQKIGTELKVFAVDEMGRVSDPLTVRVDDYIKAPLKPVVINVSERSSYATGTAEPETNIQVKSDGTVIGTAKADSLGNYYVPFSPPKDGYELEFISLDSVGRASESTWIIVSNNILPNNPNVEPVTEKSSAVIGTGTTGDLVQVWSSGTLLGQSSLINGKFSVSIPNQLVGTRLNVIMIDTAARYGSEPVYVTVEDSSLDDQAPEWPSGSLLRVRDLQETSLVLEWPAARDNRGVQEYRLFMDGTPVVSTTGNYAEVVHLEAGRTYRFTVYAVDSKGLQSNEPLTLSTKTHGQTFNRISGKDRYQTSVEISKAGWDQAETVIIARGNDFPDALAGTPLAYKLNSPILLTSQNSLTEVTKKEIYRLKARKAIILGGTGAVSDRVRKDLEDMGLTVERIAGANRFATAAAIAKRMGGTSSKAVIAYSHDFPDALAIASYAAKNGYPILLSRKNELPAETLNALKGKTSTIIVGGEGVISNNVYKSLPEPKRIAGVNRYETSVAVIRDLKLTTDKVYLANGYGFADALTGSVLAAKENAPLLLVGTNHLPTPVGGIIEAKDITNMTILGGEGAVSEKVVKTLDLLK